MFASLSAFAVAAAALEESLNPSSLSIGGGYSSGETWTTGIDADLGLRSGYRLGLGVSGTWGKTEEGPLSVNSNNVWFGTDPLQLFSGSIEYERWGQSSVIQTDTARVEFVVGADRFTFGISTQARSIGWFSRAGGTDTKRFYSTSQGISLRAGLSITRAISLGATAGQHTYNDFPSDFSELEVVGFVSESTLNIGYGFLESYYSVDLNHEISDAWSMGIGYYRARNFLDKSEFGVATLLAQWSPGDEWIYSVRGGRAESEGSDGSFQFELLARYLWF